MSYILNPEPESGSRRPRRTLLIVLAVLVVLVAAGVAYVAGRGSGRSAPALGQPTSHGISWSLAGPWPVPVSAGHGPSQVSNGLASGFSHDELGAAIAALNISYRLTSEVGPLVYETTARQQCFGDIDQQIAQTRSQPVSTNSPPASEFYYKVMSGDADGNLVLISIAEKTTEASALGGYGSFLRTLRWQGNDWQVQVPVAPAQIITTIEGYQTLGKPNV